MCGTECRQLTVKQDDAASQAVTQTPIENAGNGCKGFTETCQGANNDDAVIMTVKILN